MILGGTVAARAYPTARAPGLTLDDLFRRTVEAQPDAPAIIDPPDRESFTDGAPRRLTWAEADRVVSAITNLLASLGLPADSIVALQLPNTVESMLTLMGVLRAGLIAAPLPLLWRQVEACAALGRVGARALVSCRRVGKVDHGEIAMHVAAETFAIRFVCGFGRELPDGIIGLDEVFDVKLPPRPPLLDRAGDPADHVAVVTFDVTPDGLIPVARSHRELLAAGAAVVGEAGIAAGSTLLGTLLISSFAAIGSTVMPWLLCGGALILHQPFNPAALVAQHCDVAVLPGPLLPRLAEAGLFGAPVPHAILAVWRAPERMASGAACTNGDSLVVDVPVFGEAGLVSVRRSAGGAPATALALLPTSGPATIELMRSASGTLAVRGPMVPGNPFPPGRGDPCRLKIGENGFVDTFYPCHIDRETRMLVLDGPPAGIVSVGGYRFALRELQNQIAPSEEDGSLAVLPDVLAGHRLAGIGSDRAGIRDRLAEEGANPLVTAAFRDKRPGRASAT